MKGSASLPNDRICFMCEKMLQPTGCARMHLGRERQAVVCDFNTKTEVVPARAGRSVKAAGLNRINQMRTERAASGLVPSS